MPLVLRRALSCLPALLLSGLGACGPVYRAAADPLLPRSAVTAAEADPRRLLGSWALTDNDNLLVNPLLRPDGSAMCAAASQGPRSAAAGRLCAAMLLEVTAGTAGAMACASMTAAAGPTRS